VNGKCTRCTGGQFLECISTLNSKLSSSSNIS
jgi:hypothetical protein